MQIYSLTVSLGQESVYELVGPLFRVTPTEVKVVARAVFASGT